jgi:murein DD-endopeptidase MepM/ murein hydrolase activator NlpD
MIGIVGNNGLSDGYHLHIEIYNMNKPAGERRLDPKTKFLNVSFTWG